MKIVLATGIFPPDLGGPATYVEKLASELKGTGHNVMVLTYQTIFNDLEGGRSWPVIRVPKSGGPWLRWRRFAKALREHGSDADVVIAFSSVSCGVPLRMAGLKKPKKILRLGGDFFWERYTAVGGMLDLRRWYQGEKASGELWKLLLSRWLNAWFMPGILNSFDHVVYSTEYQKQIHEAHYKRLPSRSVIQNSLPISDPASHKAHPTFRALYLGRFVSFKNLLSLVRAMLSLPDVSLTLTGEGPMRLPIQKEIRALGLDDRVTVRRPILSDEKRQVFDDHDLMILPSLTEISPHSALEARSAGLPVLLTEETGLSDELTDGMLKADLRAPEAIVRAVQRARKEYEALAARSVSPLARRDWRVLAREWMELFGVLKNG